MDYEINSNKCIIVLHKGDDIISSIEKVCKENDIKSGSINGMGASQYAVVGIFDNNLKAYNEKNVDSFCEIASLFGNITSKNGSPYLHLHITLADNDQIYAGHLLKCVVGLTAEIFIDIFPIKTEREFDKNLGINLIKPVSEG